MEIKSQHWKRKAWKLQILFSLIGVGTCDGEARLSDRLTPLVFPPTTQAEEDDAEEPGSGRTPFSHWFCLDQGEEVSVWNLSAGRRCSWRDGLQCEAPLRATECRESLFQNGPGTIWGEHGVIDKGHLLFTVCFYCIWEYVNQWIFLMHDSSQ